MRTEVSPYFQGKTGALARVCAQVDVPPPVSSASMHSVSGPPEFRPGLGRVPLLPAHLLACQSPRLGHEPGGKASTLATRACSVRIYRASWSSPHCGAPDWEGPLGWSWLQVEVLPSFRHSRDSDQEDGGEGSTSHPRRCTLPFAWDKTRHTHSPGPDIGREGQETNTHDLGASREGKRHLGHAKPPNPQLGHGRSLRPRTAL